MLKYTLNKKDENIEEYEIKKAELLLELGKQTYQGIRGAEVNNEKIEELSSEIFELDKSIYLEQCKLDKELKKINRTTCECGNKFKQNDKFCSKCGAETEIEEVKMEFDICPHCNCELEVDCIYCTCCGYKVNK